MYRPFTLIFVYCVILQFFASTKCYTVTTENPKCTGAHEYFDCSVECDNVCSELHIQNKTNCPIVNIQCNKKCYCEEGYARDDKGLCVPIDECPPNDNVMLCPPNEEYKTCKRPCPPQLCFSLVARFKCQVPFPCEPGCACKSGYLRQKDGGPCVPICQCPELAHAPDCS